MVLNESRLVSDFNENAFQIQRLHNAWLEVARLRKEGRFTDVRWILDNIQIELSYDAESIDSREDEHFIELIEKVNLKLNYVSLKFGRNSHLLYPLLLEKERILRKIQQLSGKGATYRPYDEDEMD